MNGIGAAVAIMFLIAFLFGVTFGIVLIVSFASNREDRRHSLRGQAPDAICAGTRRLVGAGTRGDGWQADAPGGMTEEGPGTGPNP